MSTTTTTARETFDTIRAYHHMRWDVPAYQQGWERTDRAIVADYPTVDYPTVIALAACARDTANTLDRETAPVQFYRELGAAARWLAALQRTQA